MTGGTLAFRYHVDSEENYDFLRVYIDGTQTHSWSGPGRGGYVEHPVSGGAHTVRFAYTKDSSVDRGRDGAWIDNLTARDSVGVITSLSFDDRTPSIGGWSSGGIGGFAPTPTPVGRVLTRPATQAFTGWQSAATTSRIERSFYVGGTSRVAFDYIVDSEEGWDFLRVFIDGSLSWQKSGQSSGTRAIDNVAPGWHTLAFEYYKDTSVDVGRDLAAVDNIRVTTAGLGVEEHVIDGYGVGVTPYGWTSTGAVGGWRTGSAQPIAAVVRRQIGRPAPPIGGPIQLADMTLPTRLPLYDVENPAGRRGTIFLEEFEDAQTLHLSLRVHASSADGSSESGEITVYIDSQRTLSLGGRSCGSQGALPTIDDRKFVVSYGPSGGQQSPPVSILQYRGTCDASQPWEPIDVSTQETWPANAGIAVPVDDPGFVHAKISIQLMVPGEGSSPLLSDGVFGLGLTRRSTTGVVGAEPLPVFDGGPQGADVSTWMTVRLAGAAAGERLAAEPWALPAEFY